MSLSADRRPRGSAPVTAVLFDLDGTIWDSLPGITASLAHALAGLGLPVPADEALASNVGPPLREMLRHFGVSETLLDDGVRLYRERYRSQGEYECEVYDGAVALLAGLGRAGVPLATATSKGAEPTDRMLDHFDVRRHFDVVAAAAMDGREVHKEDVIADALARLGREPGDPTVAMVGDRHYDIRGGKTHGLVTIGVRWGYAPPGELEQTSPDAIVGSFDELGRLLTEWGVPANGQ